MSFLRSAGFTYSMTVVYNRSRGRWSLDALRVDALRPGFTDMNMWDLRKAPVLLRIKWLSLSVLCTYRPRLPELTPEACLAWLAIRLCHTALVYGPVLPAGAGWAQGTLEWLFWASGWGGVLTHSLTLNNVRATELTMYEAKISTRLCFPHGHCGSSKRLGLYSTASPPSFPVSRDSC